MEYTFYYVNLEVFNASFQYLMHENYDLFCFSIMLNKLQKLYMIRFGNFLNFDLTKKTQHPYFICLYYVLNILCSKCFNQKKISRDLISKIKLGTSERNFDLPTILEFKYITGSLLDVIQGLEQQGDPRNYVYVIRYIKDNIDTNASIQLKYNNVDCLFSGVGFL